MKITIISGSHRVQSQSIKVSKFIKQQLEKAEDTEAEIYTLKGNPLPLWDEGIWAADAAWEARLKPLRDLLRSSDAFVVVSPEWHGQVPAGLKNFFLICSKRELGHKPALIVTVSAGDGGAYPVAELRMSSYKNNRLCYIPEQVIVRHVESVLNESAEDNDESADEYIRTRMAWGLDILREYAIALRQVRTSGKTESERYSFGM